MAKNYKTGILITGDAKGGVRAIKLTKGELGKLNKKQKQTQNESKNTKKSIGNLMARFGAASAIIGGATAAVGLLATSLRTNAIREINATAEAVNVSTSTLTEWTYAAKQMGLESDKMGDIFKDVQDKIGDFAATGGGEAKDIFENLGLSVNELKNLNPDEQLLAIADGLDQVGTKAEKIFYLESLADEASRLLPLLENGAAGLKKAQSEARLLGVSLDEVDAQQVANAGAEFIRMKGLITGATNELTIALSPALAEINKQVVDGVIGVGGWQSAFTTATDVGIEGLGYVADRLNSAHKILKLIEIGWLQIGVVGMDALAGVADVAADVINTVLAPFQQGLATIADGWAQILGTVGEYLGDDSLISMSQSLSDFSVSAADFRISADDIKNASTDMNEQLTVSQAEFEALKNLKPSDNLADWWDKVKKSADAAAKAQVKARESATSKGPSTNNQLTSVEVKELEQAQKEFDKLIEQTESFNLALNDVGDTMVSAFGSVAQQFDLMIAKQMEFAELEAQLATQKEAQNFALFDAWVSGDEQRAAAAEDNISRIESAEVNLADNRLQANMNSYAGMAKTAGQFFGEQSSAREKLHKIETAFTIFETALALKKAAANAITAITTQGQGDPYTAFGRVAAMAAIMAGLGVFSGSAGGGSVPSSAERQESQGTGTILGDANAKSESILNSLERQEDLELDQYAELREMNTALKDLNSNIVHMAASLVGNYGSFGESNYDGNLGKENRWSGKIAEFHKIGAIFGDPVGDLLDDIVKGLSSKRRILTDSGIEFFSQSLADIINTGLVDVFSYFDVTTKKSKFWGLSESESTSTEYGNLDLQLRREFALIFTNIGDTLTGALDVLGMDALQSLDNFMIDIGSISLKDLSGDEIEAELQAIFAAQADQLAAYLTTNDYTGQMGPFQNVGSWLTDFQKVGEGLYETLIRVAQEQTVFNHTLEIMGQSLGDFVGLDMIGATQNIIELAGGIEALSDAANTYFKEFLTDAEQFDYLADQVGAQFESLGLALPDTRDGFTDLLGSLDLTTEEGQAMYAALMALLPILDQYYDAIESQADAAEAAIEAELKLAEARTGWLADIQTEIDRMGMTDLEKSLADITAWFESMIAEAAELGADTGLLENLYGQKREELAEQYILAAITTAENALTSLVDNYEQAAAQEQDLYQQRIDAISDFNSALRDEIAEIKHAMGELDFAQYYAELVNEAQTVLNQGGSVEQQLAAAETLQTAILNRYSAEMAANQSLLDAATANRAELESQLSTLTTEFEAATTQAQSAFDALSKSITNTSENIGNAIDKITAGLPGFDAIASAQLNVADAYAALTGDATNDELKRIEQLKSAISARYNAELSANNALLTAANANKTALESQLATLTTEFDAALISAQNTFDNFAQSVSAVSISLVDAISEIESTLPSFDAVASAKQNVNDAYAALTGEATNDELNRIEQLKSAISARYNAELSANNALLDAANDNRAALESQLSTLTNEFETAVSDAQIAFDDFSNSINGVVANIGNAIDKINLSLPGSDPVALYDSQINDLYSQLGSASPEQQLVLLDQLQSAIEARYSAEQSAIENTSNVALELYNKNLDSYNILTKAAEELRKAAESLLISDLSSLSISDQMNEAQNQFNQLLSRARNGDADAYNQIQGTGQRYLQLAQEYNPANYDDIFASVYGAFNELGNVNFAAPTAPELHPETLALEQQQIDLAQITITELQALQTQALLLQTQAEDALNDQLLSLETAYSAESQILEQAILSANDEIVSLQQNQIDLAQASIAELQALQQQAGSLQSQAAATLNNQLSSLEATYSTESQMLEQAILNANDEILALEQQQVDLAQSAIAELQALQTLTDALQGTATEALNSQLSDLQSAFETETQSLQQSIADADAEIIALEQAQLMIQTQALTELEALNVLMSSLELQSQSDLDGAMHVLATQLAADNAAVIATFETEIATIQALMPAETDRLLVKHDEQIGALYSIHDAIVATTDAVINNTNGTWELVQHYLVDPPGGNIDPPPQDLTVVKELQTINHTLNQRLANVEAELVNVKNQVKQGNTELVKQTDHQDKQVKSLSNLEKTNDAIKREDVRSNNTLETILSKKAS